MTRMKLDVESLYRQVGRLLAEMPDLTKEKLSDEDHLWLGRAAALTQQGANPTRFHRVEHGAYRP